MNKTNFIFPFNDLNNVDFLKINCYNIHYKTNNKFLDILKKENIYYLEENRNCAKVKGFVTCLY